MEHHMMILPSTSHRSPHEPIHCVHGDAIHRAIQRLQRTARSQLQRGLCLGREVLGDSMMCSARETRSGSPIHSSSMEETRNDNIHRQKVPRECRQVGRRRSPRASTLRTVFRKTRRVRSLCLLNENMAAKSRFCGRHCCYCRTFVYRRAQTVWCT